MSLTQPAYTLEQIISIGLNPANIDSMREKMEMCKDISCIMCFKTQVYLEYLHHSKATSSILYAVLLAANKAVGISALARLTAPMMTLVNGCLLVCLFVSSFEYIMPSLTSSMATIVKNVCPLTLFVFGTAGVNTHEIPFVNVRAEKLFNESIKKTTGINIEELQT